MDNYFVKLNAVNVNEHTEKKNGLTYLSWAWAWQEIKKQFPDANYTIYQNEALGGFPYFTDGKTAMVKTGVTINGIEHTEFLPVMDNRNKSIPVANITSFDVNKTIQRSLTKCCARHGLGLYIYAGEDIPDDANAEPKLYTPKAEATNDMPEPLQQIMTCECCGKEIKATKAKDGSTMTAIAVVAFSKSHYGKALCADCMKGESK